MRASGTKPGLRCKTRHQTLNPTSDIKSGADVKLGPGLKPTMPPQIPEPAQEESQVPLQNQAQAQNQASDTKLVQAKPRPSVRASDAGGAPARGAGSGHQDLCQCPTWSTQPPPVARHCPSGNAATSRRLPPRPATGETEVTPDSES